MRQNIYFFSLLLVFIGIPPTGLYAQGLESATVALKAGNWKVLRTIDPMKDTVRCTGIYKDNYGIQLSEDTLFVSVKGGLESITIRFDNKPALPLRLPSKIEKKIRSIIISGHDFSEATESNRLRIQASTLVSGIASEDLKLIGIKDAVESIKVGCPIQAEKSSPTAVSDTPSTPTCTDVLISRMKQQGLKENQIIAICK